MSATNGSSTILSVNNHSMNNSIDSIENYKNRNNYQQNFSNDELNSKSKEKLSSFFTNSDTKSFILNGIDVETDGNGVNKSASSSPHLTSANALHGANSRELLMFDKSFTIHENDEEVLDDFDDKLKAIENNFNEKFSFKQENSNDLEEVIDKNIEDDKHFIE